jgi:hypothetical protein
MIVAASEVTKSLPRWLISSLFRPEHVQNTCSITYVQLTVRSEACSYEIGQLGHGLDVAEDGILDALHMLLPSVRQTSARAAKINRRTLYPSLNIWMLFALGTLSDIVLGRKVQAEERRVVCGVDAFDLDSDSDRLVFCYFLRIHIHGRN